MIGARTYIAFSLGLAVGPYLSGLPASYGISVWSAIVAYGVISLARELAR